MESFIDENEFYNNQQDRFHSRRSCLFQLIVNFEQTFVALNGGKDVDVIYLDFVKAFHKVDHEILFC